MQPRVSYGGLQLFLLHNLVTRFVSLFSLAIFIFHAFPLAWPIALCLVCEVVLSVFVDFSNAVLC